MITSKKFGLRAFLKWTKVEITIFTFIATIPTVIYEVFDYRGLAIPWLPVALVGTAVAFLIGFRNNASYDRLWEARKIWGAIVNSSRAWGIMVKDFITSKHAEIDISEEELKKIHTNFIYRHIGWLAALRYQLGQNKAWEDSQASYSGEHKKAIKLFKSENNLDTELSKYFSESEKKYLSSKKNKATQIISIQSSELKKLWERGFIDNFRHLKLQGMLEKFYDQQGQCERIKTFPYPRQFATVNLFFVWIFILLVPFGMLPEFEKLGGRLIWLTIPFCVLVSWVFHTMEKVGEDTENPFEGGINDIPMAAINRTIEIDLRDMLDEPDLPEPIKPINNILM
jgi:putative membrane protein